MSSRKIEIGYVARVEGEAGLKIEVSVGQIPVLSPVEVKELVLDVWEPPRFFEGFLVGRKYYEVPDLVARICGICPVSHMLTALKALEKALGINPTQQTKSLRRLMALSQILASHLVHLYMLALPDYLGYESIVGMMPDYGEEIGRLLRMKTVANDLTRAIGGRALHPVTTVVNGFTRLPSVGELRRLAEALKGIKEDAVETVRLFASLPYPDLQRRSEYVALRNHERYAFTEGRVVSSEGLDIAEGEYVDYFQEEQVPYAMAKRSIVKGRGAFRVGALARMNLNFHQLSEGAKEAAGSVGRPSPNVGFEPPSHNPFHNNLAQALEVLHCVDECVSIIEVLDLKEKEGDFAVRAGEGWAITEAPRGLLYHKYCINDKGVVEE
ncbi:MAG: nickel-dependent hydrogenase large subunit, partial [Anaerolineae bacterium]|nr:nickel-dependent hydrogenase large subunit [Anaerolineae bacterium]